MDKKLIGAGVVFAAAVAGVMWWVSAPPSEVDMKTPITSARHSGADTEQAKDTNAIIVPEFSQVAKSGELAFYESCSACHGVNAGGTDFGPPLVHSLYRPGHHPDDAIVAAATNGVIAHHWRFGNMPPVEGITAAKLRWITKYLREIQIANGVQ